VAQARIGVIGLGEFGIQHLRCFRQMGYWGEAQLVAACDMNEELLQKRQEEFGFNAYTDFREMFDKEELDGVTVVTPDYLHKMFVVEAAQRGINVLSEKPLDVTMEGCREMIEVSESAGILLQVDFHKRFDEYHIAMRQKIEAGDLGEIEYGYAHMEDKIVVPRDWWPRAAEKSSPAWFLGIHFYDLARFLMGGAKGVRAWATGARKKLPSIGVDAWDSISAKVEFDNGATVMFDTSWIMPDPFEAIVNQGIRLVGTEGMLECDSQDRGTITCTYGEGMATHNKSFLREKQDKQGRQIFEGYGMDSIADFARNVNVLIDGGTIADLGEFPTAYDGLEATRIGVGVHKSLETGELVDLTEL
jgi:predicted dehydrogenase